MIVTLADQFLAQNAGRRYPFMDDTDIADDTAVIDLHIVLKRATAGTVYQARLKSVASATISSKEYKLFTVVVQPEPVAGDGNVLLFSIPADISVEQPYVATATASGMLGEMTVTAAALNFPEDAKDIPFARTVVLCRALEVDSVQGIDGIDATKAVAVSGDITLVPGYNSDPYIDGQRIRLDITKGGGIGERCQYAQVGQNCDNIMFTINGERPGSDGELKIAGKNGVIVTPDPDNHALVIALEKTATEKVTDNCEPNC